MFKKWLQGKLFWPVIMLIAGYATVFWFFQKPTITCFPRDTHTWAQADRYAQALGFLQNDFDFFHPQTWVLNKQFPSDFKKASPNSITAVDFPVNEYIIALLMKLLGTTNPGVFRLYILFCSFAGLLFLFLVIV